MSKTLVTILSIAAISAFVGCKKKDNTPSNSASVAFVNGCAGTSGIDAKVNGTNVSGAANITFLGNSGYKTVSSGTSVGIAYYLTNVGTPVTNQNVNLTNGGHYTAFSAGLLTAPTFLLTSDDLSTPGSNQAKIRLVNLSPDAMSVSATAGTSITFASSITANRASDFYSLPAGPYEIKTGDASNISTIVSTGTQQLAAGKIYTVMLTGTQNGTGVSALKVTLLNNN